MSDVPISFKISPLLKRKLESMAKKELRDLTSLMRKILTEAAQNDRL